MQDTHRFQFEELDDFLQERLRPRVERLGYLGEFFQVAATEPRALAGFIDFTEALKEALPARYLEIVALTISSRTGNAYERVQHERLALTVGLDATEVEGIERGKVSEQSGFSEVECAVYDLAEGIVSASGKGCPTAYAALRRLVGDRLAVAVLLTCGRYLAHSAISTTWCLEAPVRSIFDAEPEVEV